MSQPEDKTRLLPVTSENLFRNQLNVGQSILNTFTQAQNRTIVFVEGFSGAGKSALLDAINSQITQRSGTIVELPYNLEDFVLPSESHIVTSVTPREFELNAGYFERKHPQFDIVPITLKGMQMDEIMEFIAKLRSGKSTILFDRTIAEFSMGIPLLAHDLLIDPKLTTQEAEAMIASYLFRHLKPTDRFWNNVKGGLQHYVEIQPPDSVLNKLENIGEYEPNFIYGKLQFVLNNQQELAERGVIEESPLFIDPQSIELYDQTVKKERAKEKVAINVYVPNLDSEDLSRVAQALGLTPHSFGFHWEESQGTRVRMFNADWRKAGIWLLDNLGNQHNFPTDIEQHTSGLIDYKDGMMSKIINTHAPSAGVRLILHKHEHSDHHAVACMGWMLESLLQQRGIEYFVGNEILGKYYRFNPQTKKIEFIEK